jgi:BASS family bile acid:Na+ symporter
MGGIAFILTIITAAGRDNLIKVGGLLIVATLIHNLAGYFFGYWSARILKFTEKDSRTIALEVGMQNAGLASGLALSMGKLATAGLAPAIFGPVMNVTGSTLASWWHNRYQKKILKKKKRNQKLRYKFHHHKYSIYVRSKAYAFRSSHVAFFPISRML